MKGPAHLLPQLAPSIDLIATLSGVPGVSVGVIHEGDIVFRYNYGHGDVSAKKTTSDTIYPLASLSKSFASFLYASLVDEGVADWHSPIRDTLPDFHSSSPELLNDSGILSMFGSQPVIRPFRTQWLYNNLGYAIVELVMRACTGLSYGKLLESRLARPLGLERTGLSFEHCQSCDVAKPYLATEDGTPVVNEAPFFIPDTAMVAAGGIHSSVNDLLIYYGTVLQQITATNVDLPAHSLKGLSFTTSGKTFIQDTKQSFLERSYGLGWIRTQLPGTLGVMGLNPWLSQMPLINTSRLALYHQGNLPGATSAVYLFPETRSGVVVLCNAYGLSDAPDWIAQLITEVLFETGSRTDYVQFARDASESSKNQRLDTVRELEAMGLGGTPPSAPHKAFEGAYYNAAGNFLIEIFPEGDDLNIAFQGQRQSAFPLRHLQANTFTWFTSTRHMAQQGRCISAAPYYLVRFQQDSVSRVIGLEWAHNGIRSGGEVFVKSGLGASSTPWVTVWTVVSLGLTITVGRAYFRSIWKEQWP